MAQNSTNLAQEVGLSLAVLPMRKFMLWALLLGLFSTIALCFHVGWAIQHAGASAPEFAKAAMLETYEQSTDKHMAVWTSNLVYGPLFGWSGLDRIVDDAMLERENSLVRRNGPMAIAYPYILTTMYASKTVGMRLGQLGQGMLLIAILGAVVLVDGLVARQIRKATAARESGQIYQRAKALRHLMLPSMALVFCCWPSAIEPAYFVATGAAALLLSIWLQAKFYKKYI